MDPTSTVATPPQPRKAQAGHAARAMPGARRSQPALRETVDRDSVDVLNRWRKANPFYHKNIRQYLRFIVPEGESVLMFGCEDGAPLSALKPARGVGVDDRPDLIAVAAKHHPEHEYIHAAGYLRDIPGRFEYVVINDVMDEVHDVFSFLQSIERVCTPTSRLVIVEPNYLRRPIRRLAAWLGLEYPHARKNLLSAGDLQVILEGVGFETICVQPKLYSQHAWLGFGKLLNALGGLLPFIHRFSGVNILVARPMPPGRVDPGKSASIVMAVRDERDNVEPMVRAIPRVGRSTEIVIVEGHSSDGTRAEIERVMEAYPDKNVRLVVQSGDGVGNAILEGFEAATGDVIILLEADQTSPPQDVLKVFDVIASGRAEFVNGSRFIYPREHRAMPILNVVGNWVFAMWFMWFLGQRTSDVLCGLKGFDRTQFGRIRRNWGFLGVPDPFSDFEMLFGATRLGLKICEVPTRYRSRTYGTTKTRFLKHGWMLARMAVRATGVFRCQ